MDSDVNFKSNGKEIRISLAEVGSYLNPLLKAKDFAKQLNFALVMVP